MEYPCLKCGAWCASFRISFYWAESDAHPDGSVPQALAVAITPHLMAMRGTEQQPVRRAALRGDIGRQVACTLYEQRSSTRREFALGEPCCDEARRRHGLAPLGAQAPAWRETVA